MIVLVLAAVLCTAGSQYVQALAARELNRREQLASSEDSHWLAMVTEPRLYGAYALLGIGLVFWLVALTELEVSRSYPLFGLGFVLTMLLARFGLGEAISHRGWAGSLLIVAGSLLCAV